VERRGQTQNGSDHSVNFGMRSAEHYAVRDEPGPGAERAGGRRLWRGPERNEPVTCTRNRMGAEKHGHQRS